MPALPQPVTALRTCAALAACLALAACQSPNGVGLGLIDDAGDDPTAQTVAAASTDTLQTTFNTAGVADDGVVGFQARVLAGAVLDPLYGDATATATLDALRPVPVPPDFADSTLVGLELQLVRDYVYGDTTATVPLEVRAVQGGWSPTGLPSDTTLGTGDVIASFAPLATDTLIVVPLSADYVASAQETFTSDDFSSAFEGFSILSAADAAPAPGAVLGFSTTDSRIVARTSGGDSLVYPLSEVYTELVRGEPAAPPPPGRLLLQGVASTGLALQFDLGAFADLPLARARLKLPLDRTLSGAEGTFVRPLALNAEFFGRVEEDGARVVLATLSVPDEGDIASLPLSSQLTASIQSVLLGNVTFDRYEVLVRPTPVSLDVLPLVVEPDPDGPAPRLLLTLVGGPA